MKRGLQRIKTAEAYALVAVLLAASFVLTRVGAQSPPPEPEREIKPFLSSPGANNPEGWRDAIKAATNFQVIGIPALLATADPRAYDQYCFTTIELIGITDALGQPLDRERLAELIGYDPFGERRTSSSPDIGIIAPGVPININDLVNWSSEASTDAQYYFDFCKQQVQEALNDAAVRQATELAEANQVASNLLERRETGGVDPLAEAIAGTGQAISGYFQVKGTTTNNGAAGAAEAIAKANSKREAAGAMVSVASIKNEQIATVDKAGELFGEFAGEIQGDTANPIVLTAMMLNNGKGIDDLNFEGATKSIALNSGAGLGAALAQGDITAALSEANGEYVDFLKEQMKDPELGLKAGDTKALAKISKEFDLLGLAGDLFGALKEKYREEAKENVEETQEELFCILLSDSARTEPLKNATRDFISTNFGIVIDDAHDRNFYLDQNTPDNVIFDPDIVDLADKIDRNTVRFPCDSTNLNEKQMGVVYEAALASGLLESVEELGLEGLSEEEEEEGEGEGEEAAGEESPDAP